MEKIALDDRLSLGNVVCCNACKSHRYHVSAMTRTDTFAQLVDRIIIARLKAFHHGKAGKDSLAGLCDAEARMLSQAADELLAAAVAGDAALQSKANTRFHNHSAVEGHVLERPQTIWQAIDGLVLVHATYWTHQTVVTEAKAMLIVAENRGEQGIDQANGMRRVIVDSQRHLDLCNQHRNQLIQWTDELLVQALEQRPWTIYR